MRFAFCLFTYFPFGGLERNFLKIARGCLRRGHTVRIYTMQWHDAPPKDMEVELVPYRGITNHGRCVSYIKALNKILDQSVFDLVVGFNRMPGLDLYYAADVCYVQDIERRRSPLSRLTSRYRAYASFERAIFDPASKTEIMYLAEAQKGHYMQTYGTPAQRFHALPPGVDKAGIRAAITPAIREQVRHEYGLGHEDMLLLMIGSNFQTKGVGRSIRALASLPPNLKTGTHLLIVGKGKSRPFEKLAVELGVGELVRFLGGRDDVPRFLAAANLLVHPSVTENTGNAIVEALVAGVPVLTTDNCGFSAHVSLAKAGRVAKGYPYRQEELNTLLTDMLVSIKVEHWHENALAYAEGTDLYSRVAVAVETIETLAYQKKSQPGHSEPSWTPGILT